MDGSVAISEIGDNSFKSVEKKKQAKRRSAAVFHQAQFQDHCYFFYI